MTATPNTNGEICNTIRFPIRLYRKLQDLAHARKKSVNDTVCTTLDAFIEEHESKWGEIPVSPDTYASIITEAYQKDPIMVAKVVANLQNPAPKRRRAPSK